MKKWYLVCVSILMIMSFFHDSLCAESEHELVLDEKSKQIENHFQFCANVEKPEYITADIYKKIIESLPICCIDVFVYDINTKKYLMILRKDKPAKGLFFVPGGRLLKGESFFIGAERKIKEETGLDIIAQHKIDVYSTIFADSEWGCQTHTVNIVVFAELKPDQNVALDAHHQSYQWVSRDIPPTNEYLRAAYVKARSYMQ